jgi:hypothetical protein
MSDWFSTIAAGHELPRHAASELEDRGFVVLHGVVAAGSMERLTAAYTEAMTSAHEGEVLACGAAGSLVVFNGSTWHGHTANSSDQPRRSIQGAFIPRGGRAATDFSARMRAETRARLGALAHAVLALPPDV